MQLHISIRRLWALDVATRSFSVGLLCTTLHECQEGDQITFPEGASGLCLVDGDIHWTSRKFMPSLHATGAHEQVWGPWHVMVSDERGRHGRPMLLCTRTLTARLQLDFDLSDYPLDVQILSICLALTASSDVAHLVPLREQLPDGTPDLVHVDYAHIHLPTFAFVADCPHVSGVRTLRERLCYTFYRGQSQAYVHIPLARSHDSWYIASIVAPLVGIGLLACLVFALPSVELAHRMTVDAVLLLVAMVHRTYVASVLPTGRRSTRVDVFVMALFALLGAVTTCHALAPAIEAVFSEGVARGFDLLSAAACTLSWLIFTAIYAERSVRSRYVHEERLLKLMRFYQHQHGVEVDAAKGSSPIGSTAEGPSKAEQFLSDFVVLSEGGLSLHGSPTPARSISRSPVYSPTRTRPFMRLLDEEVEKDSVEA